MPKQIKELRNFIAGTTSGVSSSDIMDESPVYSQNIEALDEEGKLKGAKRDIPLKEGTTEISQYTYFIQNNIFQSNTNVSYQYEIYNTSGKYDVGTIDGNQTVWDMKSHRHSFRALVASSKYIDSVNLISVRKENDQLNNGNMFDTGYTLPIALTATAQSIEFPNTVNSNSNIFFTGQVLEVGTGTSAEKLLITSITIPEPVPNQDPPYSFRIGITRGYSGTNAGTHALSAEIKGQGDWNALQIIYKPQIQDPQEPIFSWTRDDVTTNFTKYDSSSLIEINARNLILTDNKDDTSSQISNDVVYYDYDTTVIPAEAKIKVIKNFYSKNGPRGFFTPEHSDINSGNQGYPENVSLAKGPNAVYVGTGSSESSKPQWVGKISHSQFGNKYDDYVVEDSELKAIDDGSSIFALSYIDTPHFGTSGTTREATPYLNGIGGSNMSIYAINKKTPGENVGKVFKGKFLGWLPTAIGSSAYIHSFMRAGGDRSPIINTWSGTNSDQSLIGHDANVSYSFVADYDHPDRIHIFATYMHYDNNVPQDILTEDFGYFTLEHEIVIDNKMSKFMALEDGDKIRRKPKVGSYINDIYEKNGTVYVQYGNASGFSFDEEYLYCFEASLITADTTKVLDSSDFKISCKPITPPVLKLKNFGNDYKNKGHDWYASEETCNFNGLGSGYWIGQEGFYGGYSNSVKWRNIDILGFTKNKKHALNEREIYDHSAGTWSTVEPETGMWNRYYAESNDWFSSDENSRVPGYILSATSSYTERNNNNPYREVEGKWDNGHMAPTNGFESVIIRTQTGGILNGATSESSNGEIGCATFIVGKQIVSEIDMNKGAKYSEKWSGWKAQHYLRNTKEPIIKDVSEMKILTTDKNSYGVSQRCVPYLAESKPTISRSISTTTTTNEGTENEETTTSYTTTNLYGTGGFEDLNGCSTGSFTGDMNNSLHNIDYGAGERKRPMKFAFRYGCYSSGRVEGASTYTDERQCSMYNRMFINLKTLSETSDDVNNDLILRAPDDGQGFTNTAKNYGGKDKIFTTARTTEMEKTHSYISRWDWSNHSHSTTGYEDASSIKTENPLKIKTVGTGVIQSLNSGNDEEFIIASTVGSPVRNGYIIYDHTNTNYTENTGGGYGDTITNRWYQHGGGTLDFGLNPSFVDQTPAIVGSDPVEYEVATFMSGQKYYWKLSMLYDGYQEGPLSQFEFSKENSTVYNYNNALIDFELSVPPKRVSALVLYRKNDPKEYYRMVAEVDLSKGWAYDSARDTYKKTVVDDGKTGPTYEAVTGMPEGLEKTSLNYKLSTVAQGHLIVADCYHPEIKQGQNFLYKSETNAFSNFNWAKNFCVLPTKPTAIAWFAGKVFAFDLNNTYKINLNNLVLEDTLEGVGCISQDSLIVTDTGMFFCDYQGLYYHNGQSAENIGGPILRTSEGDDAADFIETDNTTDESWNTHAWQNIDHQVNPKVMYDPKTLTVFYCFKDKHLDGTIYNGAWKFGAARKRCDLVQIPEPLGVLIGNQNDIYISGYSQIYKINSGAERARWSWKSKKFDLKMSTQDKVFYSVSVVCNNEDEATKLYDSFKGSGSKGSIYIYSGKSFTPITLASSDYKLEKNKIKCIIKGTDRTSLFLQFKLENMAYEVDSVAIVYRTKKVR